MYMLNMVIILIVMYSNVVTAIDKIPTYLLRFNTNSLLRYLPRGAVSLSGVHTHQLVSHIRTARTHEHENDEIYEGEVAETCANGAAPRTARRTLDTRHTYALEPHALFHFMLHLVHAPCNSHSTA